MFFLILGHLAGDYALQSDYVAANKGKSTAILSYHVFIYVITIWITVLSYSLLYQPGLFLQASTVLFMTALYIQHWLQDFLKSRYQNGSKQAYYVDQVMHLLILYIYRVFIY